MKKIGEKVIGFFRLIHLHTIILILLLYLMLCYACYINLRIDGVEIAFVDVVVFNLLAVAGNDYMFTDSPWTRVTGLFVLGLGMVGFSAITGYISSAYVASRLSQERGIKRMQNMKNHIIICGWKSDIKILIQDILRKNKDIKITDLILINNMDEVKLQTLRDAEELKGLNLLKGDYAEEQTLLNANVKKASKVLIIGENHENMDAELVDSRVFVTALMIRNLNAKCHICAEVKTERYKNYLESQNCAEVIYVDEYTRYILATSTNYSGMSRVMSSFLDNGDGTSVQIAPIPEKWVGKTYGELFAWYKKEQHILLLGILENMGVEKELKHQILSEAQKSTNYGEIIQRLKSVKNMETNCPRLNPSDDYVLGTNMGAIILGEEV
ncbi:MAG: NAD-binding protein [Lachnospiraceae bacterium]|nr:NAD-binding protein [Lachnospiraceae bacterium]